MKSLYERRVLSPFRFIIYPEKEIYECKYTRMSVYSDA